MLQAAGSLPRNWLHRLLGALWELLGHGLRVESAPLLLYLTQAHGQCAAKRAAKASDIRQVTL